MMMSGRLIGTVSEDPPPQMLLGLGCSFSHLRESSPRARAPFLARDGDGVGAERLRQPSQFASHPLPALLGHSAVLEVFAPR